MKLGSKDSPIDRVTSITANDGRVYVTGAKLIMGGMYFDSESVLEYTPDGKYAGERYRLDYGEEDYITFPQIMDVRPAEHGSLQLLVKTGRSSAEVLFVSGGGTELEKSLEVPYKLTGGKLWGNRDGGFLWQKYAV